MASFDFNPLSISAKKGFLFATERNYKGWEINVSDFLILCH